jgi:Domain of unknown function (DUF5615)
MRFLADESCDFSVVRALRSADHDVVAIAEVSPREEDTSVMDRAVKDSRILITGPVGEDGPYSRKRHSGCNCGGAPQPNTALLIAECFASLEAQQTFSDFTGRIVANIRVTGPTKNAVKKLKLAPMPPELAGNGSEAEAPWRDFFLQ